MWRWLWWATGEWTLIGVACAITLRWPWFTPIALLIIGRGQHALAVLGHEGSHRAITRRRSLNDRLTNWLCFWPLGVDVGGYRIYHLPHHAFLGIPGRDSELLLKARYAHRWSNLTPTKRRWLVWHALLGLAWREVLGVSTVLQGRYTAARVAYLAAVVGAVLALGLWPLLALWIVALFTINFALHRMRMWREHVGTDSTLRYTPKLWERLVYLPHYTWRHALHHESGKWSVPAWDLR